MARKKKIDIVDVKAAIKNGDLSAYLFKGSIILKDNQTEEQISLGKAEEYDEESEDWYP